MSTSKQFQPHQRTSTKLTAVEQLEFFARKPVKKSAPIDIDRLKSFPTFLKALKYAIDLTDLEAKEIYGDLGKDKATWTRIKDGDVAFPADAIDAFCNIVDNDALVLWLLNRRGYDISSLKRLGDDKDKRIADLEAQLIEVSNRNRIIAEFVKETMR